jgi:transposase
MGRNKTRLILTAGQLADLRRRLRTAKDEREKERLRVVVCAARGKHTLEDLARMSARVRATIQTWLKKFHEGGIPALLDRNTPPGSISPVQAPDVQAQLRAGIEAGRWRSAGEVAAWLKEVHGIERATKSMYYWLAKTRSSAQREAR